MTTPANQKQSDGDSLATIIKQPDTVFNRLPWHPALHDYRGNPSDLLDRSFLKCLDLQGRPDDQTHACYDVMRIKIKVQRQKIKDRADSAMIDEDDFLTFAPSFPAAPGKPCSPAGPAEPGCPLSPIGPVSPVLP